MGYNLVTNTETCYSTIPNLLYYSHIPSACVVLFLGVLILFKNKENHLLSKILFFISALFSIWVILEGSIWLMYSSAIMITLWSFLGILYVLIHILSLYFVYVSVEKKDVSVKTKYIFIALLLPLILLTPSMYNIAKFDVANCAAVEGNYFILYRYFVGASAIGYIGVFLYLRYKKVQKEFKNQILLLGIGITLFLLAFSWSEISGSLTQNWEITQYGLFGMPVFAGILAYTIVRYKAFNIKLIGAQALTVALWVLVGSLFFLSQDRTSRIVTGGTLFLAVAFGVALVKSVKKEVAQREQIEELAGRLQSVNRIMSHDIKNVLGKNKDMYGMLLDGTFGLIPEGAKPFLERLLCDTKQLVRSVISILESGQEFTLKLAPFDVKKPVLEIIKDVKHDAEEKGLTIKTEIDESQDYTILGDEVQLSTRVFRNLIENAVNYTLAGSVTVGLLKKADKIIFFVADTGVGITIDDQKNLFTEGGHGKDSIKVNVHSTGYGLFSAKKVVDAHGGKIWFETKEGKGTTFFVEMPINK